MNAAPRADGSWPGPERRPVPANKITVPVWLLLAWFTPPSVAQLLGWDAIWGGPRVFADYAVPFPTTGGFFHLMTLFMAATGVLFGVNLRKPWRELTPAFVLALGLLGGSLLVDIGDWYLERTTDLAHAGSKFQENPLGLFLVSDALFCLVWLIGRRDVWPSGAVSAIWSVVIAVVPVLLVNGALMSKDKRVTGAFAYGTSLMTKGEGNAEVTKFTRMKVSDPGFREAAIREASEHTPHRDSQIADQAVYFMTSLDLARNARDGFSAAATYCMYADGTPAVWHDGYGDCFSGHENEWERRQANFDQLLAEGYPSEVAAYLNGIEWCRSRQTDPTKRAECVLDKLEAIPRLLQHHGQNPKVRARLEGLAAEASAPAGPKS